MPALIQGYDYDIFISYRQNDNRSGWVTEFVKALQEELSTTIKDSVSVYFDSNPHDGLLETHNVDKTLESKLRCLIFIPIVSQTYCDPKSFAWQHEFCAFNKLSKEDQLGRDIRLANGNVVSRILPVKIHDVDADDKKLLEAELGGVLRAIEFIFKSAGVNRPLRAVEEHPQDNQNKTFYRDQINKVANAIKEMMAAFKNGQRALREKTDDDSSNDEKPGTSRSIRKPVLIALVVVSVTLGLYYFSTINKSLAEVALADKSVAVLAFVDLSPNKDQEWFSDGLTEEILNSLANLRELKVTARTSSFYFKGKDVPFHEIAEKLGVAHIVEGSVRRNGQALRITAQLIRTSDGFHLWSNTYDRTQDDIFKVQTDIAENIAKALLITLSPDKQSKLVASQSTNVQAYEYYLRGYRTHMDKYFTTYQTSYFEEAERYFLKSISIDPDYAEAYGALADLYDTRSNHSKETYRFRRLRDSTMAIGFRLNPNSVQVRNVLGWSFLKRDQPNYDSSFHHFKRAYEISPNDIVAVFGMGSFYGRLGLTAPSLKFMNRSLQLDPLSTSIINSIGYSYLKIGNMAEAKKLFEKGIELDNGNLRAHHMLAVISAVERDHEALSKRIETIQKLDSGWTTTYTRAMLAAIQGKESEALKISRNLDVYSILGMKQEFLMKLDSMSNTNERPPDPAGLAKDPLYGFVRDDPKFKAIMQKVQKRYDENLARYPPPD